MVTFVLFALGAWTLGLVLRIDALAYAAYLSLGVWAWSRWYAAGCARRLRVRRTYQDHAFLGEDVDVRIDVANLGRLRLPWVMLRESNPIALRGRGTLDEVVSVPGRGETQVRYQIRPNRRGRYRLGPLFATTGDLFGLAREYQSEHQSEHVTVYPRITALAKLGLPSRLPFGTVTAARPLFMHPARPVGIREYRAGDTLRQIHWKATAHSGALSVKTFEPAISLDTAILLDLHRGDYDRSGWLDRTEWAIEVAASAASHLIDHRQAVGLATNGVDPLRGDDDAARGYDPDSGRLVTSEALGRGHMPGRLLPRPGRSQLMSVLEILARVESSHTLEFAQWTPGACLGFGWGITLLAVVPHGDETVCHALHRLLRRGFNPILIVTEPVHFVPIQRRARSLGFRAYRATRRSDLDRISLGSPSAPVAQGR